MFYYVTLLYLKCSIVLRVRIKDDDDRYHLRVGPTTFDVYFGYNAISRWSLIHDVYVRLLKYSTQGITIKQFQEKKVRIIKPFMC